MTGAGRDAADIRRALADVLDGDAATAARDRIRTFTTRYHIGADGQSAARAARVIAQRTP
jgi:hypothetical protein